MAKSDVAAIKKWIKTMGFELVNSHVLKDHEVEIYYYTLGNFGLYEKVSVRSDKLEDLKYITWNTWGIDFEVHSLEELQNAYQEFVCLSPDLKIKTFPHYLKILFTSLFSPHF
jgi:hypothetical protein